MIEDGKFRGIAARGVAKESVTNFSRPKAHYFPLLLYRTPLSGTGVIETKRDGDKPSTGDTCER